MTSLDRLSARDAASARTGLDVDRPVTVTIPRGADRSTVGRRRSTLSAVLVTGLLLGGCTGNDPAAPTTLTDARTDVSTAAASTTASAGTTTDPVAASDSAAGTAAAAALPAGLSDTEQADALAGANVLVEGAALYDSIRHDPVAKPDWTDDLQQFFGFVPRAEITADLADLIAINGHMTGATVQTNTVTAYAPTQMTIDSCVDRSGTRFLDASGTDITQLEDWAAGYVEHATLGRDAATDSWLIADYHTDDPVQRCER